MKLGTMIKMGAVSVAAAVTAAGSLVLTAKAVKKLGNDAFPENPTQKGFEPQNNPLLEKLVAGGLKVSQMAKNAVAEKQAEAIYKTDFKYTAPADEKKVTPAPVAPTEKVEPEVVEAPVFEPIIVEAPKPVEVPVIAEEPAIIDLPISIPMHEPEPIPEPVVVEPVVEEPAPVQEEAPAQEQPQIYADLPMELPYLAGKLGKEEEELAEVIVTPAEQKAQEEAVTLAPIEPEEAYVEPVESYVEEVQAEPAIEMTSQPISYFDDASSEPLVENTESLFTDFSSAESTISLDDIVPTEDENGRKIVIGETVVSEKVDDPAIVAVTKAYGLAPENLISIVSDQTMVFEFLYADMRNDATLINVFFVLPDGTATMPPEMERESVLAFARNFITSNDELRNFLAGK